MRRVRRMGCVCLCDGWEGGWVEEWEEGKRMRGGFKTPLLEILYHRWSMNAFDYLTHFLTAPLGVWKLPSSLIYMFFFVFLFCVFFLFFSMCFLVAWNLLTKSKLVQKRMKLCSFQEEKTMQILPGTEMSQIHCALFRTRCCCFRTTPHLLSLVFFWQIILDLLFWAYRDNIKCVIQSEWY